MSPTQSDRPTPGTSETAESATNAIENDNHSITTCCLDAEHIQELEASAISSEVMAWCGVYTARETADLPESVKWVARHSEALPALVYPAQEVDGTPVVQVKPARPLQLKPADPAARPSKYISGSGSSAPQLPVLRHSADADDPTWLIVEGVKQSLAALSWAPEHVGVVRIAGIHAWKRDGAPTPHLSIVAGGRVVIFADADARTNRMVYDGASELGEACSEAGATSVTFATAPGGANTPLNP